MIQNEIFYATGNRDKFKISSTYIHTHFSDIKLTQLALELPEEQTNDLQKISQDKALAAWHHTKAPVLADDVGVYFDAYKNFPGFMTKFVWQSLGQEGMFKLLDQNNRAHISIYLTYCNGPDDIHTFIGTIHGRMVKSPEPIPANTGKPFNYMLIPDGFDKPYGLYDPPTPETSFRLNGLKQFAQWFLQSRSS